jgi:hypothetical protein
MLVVLEDTSSTHTFVKEAVVPHLSLQVMPRPGLTIKAANDERVVSQGVCKEADMVIDAKHFITDLYVLPLDDFDIVLSVQWLHTLSPIVWYFGAAWAPASVPPRPSHSACSRHGFGGRPLVPLPIATEG